MVERRTSTDEDVLDPSRALTGVLALLVAEREERLATSAEPRKTEVILERAGLTASEIALVSGKNYDAVRKTLQRARKDA